MLFNDRRRRKRFRLGTAPGQVDPEDVASHLQPRLSVFSYDTDTIVEEHDVTVERALELLHADRVTWVNVDGLGDLDILRSLWTDLNVHPLVQEDVVNTHQRPKFEAYPDHEFLVLPMLQLLDEELLSEQVSVLYGKGWILSFQERPGDIFDPVRERIRQGRPRLRAGGSDYLAYALLDAVVDAFFPILETYGEWIDELEDEIIEEPQRDALEEVHEIKRDLLALKRAAWPVRDAISTMVRAGESSMIASSTATYLRDVHDHTIRIIDILESYREVSMSLADMYYSVLSHRMNEVMKVLTIVATIFIPLTFIAGVYGMNFANMPELEWQYGYFVTLGFMGVVALAMLVMFQRRGWL